MLAGLLVDYLSILGGNYKYMRRNAYGSGDNIWSVHEFDQSGILELRPKFILDFGLKLGIQAATCRPVATHTKARGHCADPPAAVKLRGYLRRLIPMALALVCMPRVAAPILKTAGHFRSFGAEAGLPRIPQDIMGAFGARCSLRSHPVATGTFAAAFFYLEVDFFAIDL